MIINFENICGKSEECEGTSITRRSVLDAGERKFFSVESHIADMNYEKEIIR